MEFASSSSRSNLKISSGRSKGWEGHSSDRDTGDDGVDTGDRNEVENSNAGGEQGLGGLLGIGSVGTTRCLTGTAAGLAGIKVAPGRLLKTSLSPLCGLLQALASPSIKRTIRSTDFNDSSSASVTSKQSRLAAITSCTRADRYLEGSEYM